MQVVSVADETKAALDDSRTLMLGSQILLGFQLEAPFQDAFGTLSVVEKSVLLAVVPVVVGVIGLLIAPSARHRLVERGEASRRFNGFISRMVAITIPLFAMALALDLFIAADRIGGPATGAVAAVAAFGITMIVCGVRVPLFTHQTDRRRSKAMSRDNLSQANLSKDNLSQDNTPLSARIDYILTEARVILPGAQALLGFQLVIVLTKSFAELAAREQVIHGVAFALVSLATALLMAPAARHRLVYDGRESEDFHQSGNRYLLAATVALAAGITADVWVVALKIAGNEAVALVVSCLCGTMLTGLWHVWPLIERRRIQAARTPV